MTAIGCEAEEKMTRAARSMKKTKTMNRTGSAGATAEAGGNHAKSALATAKRVLRIEAEAISGLIERLDGQFEKAVELLYGCKGRVVVTGPGKSGLIGRKFSATFWRPGPLSI